MAAVQREEQAPVRVAHTHGEQSLSERRHQHPGHDPETTQGGEITHTHTHTHTQREVERSEELR